MDAHDGRLLVRGRTHQSFLPPRPERRRAAGFVVDEKTARKPSEPRAAFPTATGPDLRPSTKRVDQRRCWMFSGPGANYHTDREQAQKLGFPNIVVQGMMTTCFAAQVMHDASARLARGRQDVAASSPTCCGWTRRVTAHGAMRERSAGRHAHARPLRRVGREGGRDAHAARRRERARVSAPSPRRPARCSARCATLRRARAARAARARRGARAASIRACLLHALARLASELGLTLAAGHVHHGLRGAEADADEASCRRARAALGRRRSRARRVEPRVLREGASASRARPTLQEAARRLRYEALRELAARARLPSASPPPTTLDDQAETVLLRLLRGSGPDGPRRNPRAHRGRLDRAAAARPSRGPRSNVTRSSRGLSWREDAEQSRSALRARPLAHELARRDSRANST